MHLMGSGTSRASPFVENGSFARAAALGKLVDGTRKLRGFCGPGTGAVHGLMSALVASS